MLLLLLLLLLLAEVLLAVMANKFSRDVVQQKLRKYRRKKKNEFHAVKKEAIRRTRFSEALLP